jgi:hypothetical protein
MEETPSQSDLSFNGLAVLYQIAHLLASGRPLEEIMSSLLEVLEVHAGMNRGMITIVSPGNDELAVDVARGITEGGKKRGKYRFGEGITGKVVATGRPIAIPALSKEPTFLDRTGARRNLKHSDLSFMCVPIKTGTTVVGALSVDRVAVENALTLEGELRFLELQVRTTPPPVTRSSSPMPVEKRGASCVEPLSPSRTMTRPPDFRDNPVPGGAATAVSSVSVFHSPHDGHLPSHRGDVDPQFWQTNWVLLGFAIASVPMPKFACARRLCGEQASQS